jgi:hypothetical protein
MPTNVADHREAAKEARRLPRPVRQTFGAIRAGLEHLDHPPGYREQIICTRRPRRILHIAEARHGGVHYRMAWEVEGDRVVVWMYGAHEGFYAALRRRAGC